LWNVQLCQNRNIVTFVPGNGLGADGVNMQVLCKKTNGNAEAHCCVCGQGFVMFWDRQSRIERIAALHETQQVLRQHHRLTLSPEAHPGDSFPVPEWSGTNASVDMEDRSSPPTLDL
jgi:hypothetical protein